MMANLPVARQECRPRKGGQPYIGWLPSAMHSISTSAPLGRVLTATALRAGKGLVKKEAYTSFMAAKSPISARKTVVLTTWESERPASCRMACALRMDWRECARRGVDGKLSGKENQAGATADGLAVRADGGRCFFSADRFHIYKSTKII